MNTQSNQLALVSSFSISLLSRIQNAMNECEIPFKIEEFTLRGNVKGFNLFVKPENLKVTLALVDQVEFQPEKNSIMELPQNDFDSFE